MTLIGRNTRASAHRPTRLAMVTALAASVLTGCAPAPADDQDIELTAQRYTLDNGLTVILRDDDTSPLVAVNLWYHVGPANETAGRTGFAHLFEHMMFQGSGHVPEGQHAGRLQSAGATDLEASTGYDRTNYYATVPSAALETALWLESDRMGFLLDTLDAAQLANQQAVVRNERRQNFEEPPYAPSDEVVHQQLFPREHPYHARVIGSHADIQAAGLDDVRAFFEQYYVPNNASLAIVGDIDVDATRKLVEKYFGTIARGAEVPAPEVTVPVLSGERRLTVTDQVQLPRVSMSWVTPPIFAPGDVEGVLTTQVLAGGRASRLYTALVLSGIAQDVTATVAPQRFGSVFQIVATARPGRAIEEVESVIQRELEALAATAPTPAELAAKQTGVRSQTLFGLENPNTAAELLNAYEYYRGDPNYLAADLRRYADVRPDQVRRFVTDHLRKDRRVVVHTIPGPRVVAPEPPTPAPPTAAETDRPPSAEPWRATVPPLGRPVPPTPPAPQRFELANGLPVYLVESHALPLAVASLVTGWGSATDPPDRAGLAAFAGSMLDEGTTTRDGLTIARELETLGATLGSDVDNDYSSVDVAALSSQIGPAMGLLADMVRFPALPPAEVERVRAEILVSLQQRRDDPSSVANLVTLRELYGDAHPYGHPVTGSEAGVRAITRDDLMRFHQTALTPRNSALILAGDLSQEQARDLAEQHLGGWTGSGARPPRPGPPRPSGPERVIVVDRPGAVQTALTVAQASVTGDNPDFEKLLAMNQVLGGTFSSRINLNLRERNGFSYRAGSFLSRDRGPGSIDVSADVRTEVTGASVRETLAEVTGMRERPATVDELRLAAASLPLTLYGDGSLRSNTGAIADLHLLDLPPGYYGGLANSIGRITADDIVAVAREHLRPDQLKIIAIGDRAKIDPQLAGLGLGPIGYRTADGDRTR